MLLATVVLALLERYEMKHLFRKPVFVTDTIPTHRSRGFTIVELVVIFAIIAILTGIATLSFPKWRDNMKLKATARDVVSHFQFARLEAAKRNSNWPVLVQIVAGGPGTVGCTVFVDNGQGGGTADDSIPNGSETLRELELPARVSITGTTLSPFAFNNRGIPTLGGGTITLTNGDRTYNVVVSAAGAISLNGPV
jgi:Tfp pilus assembly protein FimT